MSRPTLGDLDLMQSSFSGFGYPGRAQIVPLLSPALTAGGNAVLQSGPLTFRQATISWLASDPDDVATARGYHESLEAVDYTDHEGNATSVRVTEFSSAERVGDYWDCSATLVEVP